MGNGGASAVQRSRPASRFRSLLTHGTFYTAGVQLSNVAVVLPFICASNGLPWAAALLYPVFSIGVVAGNSMASAILNWFGHHKHLVVAATAITMAALAGCNATVAATGVLVAAVFSVTAAAIGVISGVTSVAFSDLVSAHLPEGRRGDLLLNQGALGSVVATTITLVAVPLLARGDTVTQHVHLLWLGAAGLAAAAIAAVFVGPVRRCSKHSVSRRRPIREIYRDGWIAARSQPWFRRYAVTQLAFVPITLGSTFYSLRAAQYEGGGLQVLVVFSSIGLVTGSVLWRKIYRLFGVRGMLLGSVVLSSSAALICLWAEAFGQWSHVWVCGAVFMLSTIAGQAIFAAAISWISVLAAERERATLIGFASALVAVQSSLVGTLLGGIAQHNSTRWPVALLLMLNLIAAAAAMKAPTRPQSAGNTAGEQSAEGDAVRSFATDLARKRVAA